MWMTPQTPPLSWYDLKTSSTWVAEVRSTLWRSIRGRLASLGDTEGVGKGVRVSKA